LESRQFIDDLVKVLQELVDGAVAAHHVGVGAVLDEVLQLLAAAVQHIGEPKALPNAQLLRQFQHRPCGWAPRKDVIRDRAQAEYVQAGAMLSLGL
jgi:hypothetical protein